MVVNDGRRLPDERITLKSVALLMSCDRCVQLRFNHVIVAKLQNKKLFEVMLLEGRTVHHEQYDVFRGLTGMPRRYDEVCISLWFCRELCKKLLIRDIVPAFTLLTGRGYITATVCNKPLHH